MAAMSGGTSQPNLNSLVAAWRITERETGLDLAMRLTVHLRLLGSGARVLPAVR
jgi:pyruvate carboxylase